MANVAVIGANGGMPVRGEAILTVDRDLTPAQLTRLEFGAKRHLEQPDDQLTFLGDVVPVRPLRQVVSFGDLILAVGMADVVVRSIETVRPVIELHRHALDVDLPHGDELAVDGDLVQERDAVLEVLGRSGELDERQGGVDGLRAEFLHAEALVEYAQGAPGL